MGLLTWILIGVVAGWAASVVTRRHDRRAYLVNIVVATIGAIAGGFSANLVTRHPVLDFSLESFFVGILGTVVFVAVANAVQRP